MPPVPTPSETRTSRFEAIIALLVGVLALSVSAYTAYVQRQQVRAAVWPILEYSSSNEPHIRFILENKGVGPAIIRNVVVTVDGQPVRHWHEALQKLAGPGQYKFTQSTISGHVFSAGESLPVLIPKDADGALLTSDKPGSLWAVLNQERARVGVEICYCSTLGDCWLLRSGPNGNSTPETNTCPAPSDKSFQQ